MVLPARPGGVLSMLSITMPKYHNSTEPRNSVEHHNIVEHHKNVVKHHKNVVEYYNKVNNSISSNDRACPVPKGKLDKKWELDTLHRTSPNATANPRPNWGELLRSSLASQKPYYQQPRQDSQMAPCPFVASNSLFFDPVRNEKRATPPPLTEEPARTVEELHRAWRRRRLAALHDELQRLAREDINSPEQWTDELLRDDILRRDYSTLTVQKVPAKEGERAQFSIEFTLVAGEGDW
ncbi:hypothetical protein F4678DRAFT_465634 [Xylaria arbuscula]|nr:hypothetical protein F4678DRAFT_465634 [Xylaria arbuscula]